MIAREKLNQLKEKFGPAIQRADLPGDRCLFVYVEPPALKEMCRHVFRDLDARYVTSIGADDRPFSGQFLVAHNFAFDKEHLLCSILVYVPADHPRVDRISDVVPAANWAEREFRDLHIERLVRHEFDEPHAGGTAHRHVHLLAVARRG